ncbi:twin transmembrane helix small protein [Andreprevotia chitinilytica]|uniref:twin transmembrane helix small protein n=1 Tax=Andreprevotia chitinilytica TaxID=396808 RepID=UPI000551D37C|nr:twin transmembrane helix small protein [Andreprevotia chitinilytica]
MKLLIVALLLVVLAVLGSALLQLIRGPSGSPKLVRSLTWRIGLSILIFVLLLVARGFGWLQPHGI